ncbi:DUF3231 family protein [Bacillus rubiinfantis]|uniref:DUF3231 family protein n=1 Tax=Bacillus rubiinfantis TaxID=1499680 RepID=UPI0005A6A4D4|nr:DUF3231 family protein [Bacillus rubiinfantis]
MNKEEEIVKLTSAEISALWTTYMNVSVVFCLITHFSETCSDPEILTILDETKHFAQKHMNEIEQLLLKEKIVIPAAFNDVKHVVPNAPKLFSDIFYIQSVLCMCKFGIASHTASFTLSARKDLRKLFKEFIDDVSHLNNHVVDCMQEKGIFVRMPFMNYPSKVDFIKKENFLTGWFSRRRSLLGIEVTHLMLNSMQNEMGKAICTGFSQVTQDQEIRDYFLRGKHLCKHITSSIHDVLEESDIPVNSMSWDKSVTNSTVAPFSDQLMLFIIGILSNLGISAYGAGLSTTMRRDISAMYANFLTKTGTYGEDGVNLMIKRNWMEQPPQF